MVSPGLSVQCTADNDPRGITWCGVVGVQYLTLTIASTVIWNAPRKSILISFTVVEESSGGIGWQADIAYLPARPDLTKSWIAISTSWWWSLLTIAVNLSAAAWLFSYYPSWGRIISRSIQEDLIITMVYCPFDLFTIGLFLCHFAEWSSECCWCWRCGWSVQRCNYFFYLRAHQTPTFSINVRNWNHSLANV